MRPEFGFNRKETKNICLVFITLVLILRGFRVKKPYFFYKIVQDIKFMYPKKY